MHTNYNTSQLFCCGIGGNIGGGTPPDIAEFGPKSICKRNQYLNSMFYVHHFLSIEHTLKALIVFTYIEIFQETSTTAVFFQIQT